MSKPINRQVELRELLEQLNLGGMAALCAEAALRAAKEHLTHEAYLWELAVHERDLRTQRRTARLLRTSGLPVEKTFRTFDLGKLPALIQTQVERLKRGAFLESATNVVAVGYELACLGHPVLWLPTSTLVQRLLAAKRDLRLPQELAKLDKFACVILDDLGYIQQDRDEMEVLFTFFSERYERKSIMLSTNLVFSQWERIFKHPMTALAAIDRIVHHSVILDMMAVESYRATEATILQQAQQASAEAAILM